MSSIDQLNFQFIAAIAGCIETVIHDHRNYTLKKVLLEQLCRWKNVWKARLPNHFGASRPKCHKLSATIPYLPRVIVSAAWLFFHNYTYQPGFKFLNWVEKRERCYLLIFVLHWWSAPKLCSVSVFGTSWTKTVKFLLRNILPELWRHYSGMIREPFE